MEQLTYERPREKLQARGASFLTTVELVQIILGSGSARVSVARLAKRVVTCVDGNDVSYEQLCAINGIGQAKASQILAAVELGRRLFVSQKRHPVGIDSLRIRQAVGKYRHLTAAVYYFDGAGAEIQENSYSLKELQVSVHVQHIIRDALAVNARSLIVALGSRRDTLQVTTKELDIIKHLKDSLGLLSMRLEAMYRANMTKVEKWQDI